MDTVLAARVWVWRRRCRNGALGVQAPIIVHDSSPRKYVFQEHQMNNLGKAIAKSLSCYEIATASHHSSCSSKCAVCLCPVSNSPPEVAGLSRKSDWTVSDQPFGLWGKGQQLTAGRRRRKAAVARLGGPTQTGLSFSLFRNWSLGRTTPSRDTFELAAACWLEERLGIFCAPAVLWQFLSLQH